MKKLISLALAMLLCVGAVAMADSVVTSKTGADMADVLDIKTENGVDVADDFEIGIVKTNNATPEQTEQCNQMIAELAAAAKNNSLVKHFSNLKDNNNNPVNVTEILGTDKLVVKEVVPLIVQNYDPSYGSVTVTFKFASWYEKDEPVVVVIRVVDPATGTTKDIALQGKGLGGVDGGIEVEFPPEVMMAIQNGNATMAVISSGENK